MHISEKALAEFRSIWEQHHPGEEITNEELLAQAIRVLLAVKIVNRPIPYDKI